MVLAGAVLLGLAAAVLAVMATQHESTAGPGDRGLYTGESAKRADALVKRLTQALLAMQMKDGGFYAGDGEVGVQTAHEKLASNAIAASALARVQQLGIELPDIDVRERLDLALRHLRKNQTESGAIGALAVGPEQRFFQIDATAASLYALITFADVDSVKAARKAGPALADFANDGLRNGWSRALAAMSVERVFVSRRGKSVFRPEDGRVMKGRQVGDRDGRDFRVTEAIVRTVLQPGSQAVDAFPAQVLADIRSEAPLWITMQSDMQLWWMEAWLVARGGDPAPWFEELIRTLEEDAILADGRLPGGYFADTLVQTACGILAVLEGWG